MFNTTETTNTTETVVTDSSPYIFAVHKPWEK